MLISVATLATPAEFITAGLTETTFGVFAILGLVIVDAAVQKIDWSAPNTLTWLALLGVLALLGLTMIIAGLRQVPHKMDG